MSNECPAVVATAQGVTEGWRDAQICSRAGFTIVMAHIADSVHAICKHMWENVKVDGGRCLQQKWYILCIAGLELHVKASSNVPDLGGKHDGAFNMRSS